MRVIVNASQLATIGQGLYGPRRSYQDALDSIIPRGSLLAHVGGDRFNGNCMHRRYICTWSPPRRSNRHHSRRELKRSPGSSTR